MARRVAVVGGGASGLTCIKCCLDEGLEPVCFESSDDIGGLWRFKENPEPDRASIYQSLIINSSKEMMSFSDFPAPAHLPNYMHNSLVMDYFRMYADKFQLTKHINFNTKVLQVKQRPDFSHSGQWEVETENKDGQKEKHVFDAVMICIGHHCHPNLPLDHFPVIGGGASGLTCIKCCLDEGLEPVCFESSDDIGGLWRFKENPEPERASIYHSVIINTSKEMMCYSDYPIPAHYPNYMHNSLLMDYFRSYADKFQLTKYIRFNTKVLQVKQRPNFSQMGQWDIETETKDGHKEKHVFDAVMICIGHHCNPNLPLHDFPGIDTFTGKYFHSRDYKTPEEWRDKKAVVIGIGNSGGDIAVELSSVTKQLYLSTRRGAWVVNRVWDNGLPLDLSFNRVFNFLRQLLPFGFFCRLWESRLNQRFDHALYNLKPKHRLFSQHPTVNDELPNRILSGTVQVKPNIRRFCGSSVEFDDGSVVEDVDLVVFATGYSFSFPFLASQVVSVIENKASLYKNVFPPELERPTLAIIGLVQPLGAIMPISEMQGRWATQVFKGSLKLPSTASMLKDVRCKREAMAKRYVHSQRHTIQVDYVVYMDEISKLAGVKPNLLKLLLTDPRLGLNLLFGPCTPYQYRLQGPGKWAGARQAIFTQWERVAQPMQTRPCGEPEPKGSIMWPLILSAAGVGTAAYIGRNNLPAVLQDPTALLDKIKAFLPAQ